MREPAHAMRNEREDEATKHDAGAPTYLLLLGHSLSTPEHHNDTLVMSKKMVHCDGRVVGRGDVIMGRLRRRVPLTLRGRSANPHLQNDPKNLWFES